MVGVLHLLSPTGIWIDSLLYSMESYLKDRQAKGPNSRPISWLPPTLRTLFSDGPLQGSPAVGLVVQLEPERTRVFGSVLFPVSGQAGAGGEQSRAALVQSHWAPPRRRVAGSAQESKLASDQYVVSFPKDYRSLMAVKERSICLPSKTKPSFFFLFLAF